MTEKHKGNKTGKSADRNITRSDAKKSVERIFIRNLLASAVVICVVGGGVLWYRSQAAGPADDRMQAETAVGKALAVRELLAGGLGIADRNR